LAYSKKNERERERVIFTSLSFFVSSFAFAQRESNRIYIEKKREREKEKRWMPVVLLQLPR
jgi:hypothetical protein